MCHEGHDCKKERELRQVIRDEITASGIDRELTALRIALSELLNDSANRRAD